MARKKKTATPEMTDPILHGIPNWKFPDDHHLNLGVNLVCEHCDQQIYSAEAGTTRTWIETGAWAHVGHSEEGHVKSTFMNFCIVCFAQYGDVFPVMDTRFCFNSDTWAPPGGEYTKELAGYYLLQHEREETDG